MKREIAHLLHMWQNRSFFLFMHLGLCVVCTYIMHRLHKKILVIHCKKKNLHCCVFHLHCLICLYSPLYKILIQKAEFGFGCLASTADKKYCVF